MRELSFKVGRLFGISIHVHWLLAFMIAVRLLQSLEGGAAGFRWELLISSFVFGVILLHELGHCFAGRRVGGGADRILMWPLGGLAYVHAPHQPMPQLIVAAGGPLVNLALILVLLPVMIYRQEGPASCLLEWGEIRSWTGALFAVNLDLLLFNLIPAYPLDGGRMLKSLLWMRFGEIRATLWVVYVGWVFGGLLVVVGLFGLELLLVFLGVWAIAQCENERRQLMDRGSGYLPDFPFESARRSWHAPVSGWWAERKERRARLFRERAARDRRDREQRVDELLEKVTRTGMASLTPKERRFLERASSHYRDRGNGRA